MIAQARRHKPTPQDEAVELTMRLHEIGAHVDLPDPLELGLVYKTNDPRNGGSWFVRVGSSAATCNVTGNPLPWWGRKFYISPHMTDGEIVQTIFLACRVAQEHELREGFKYKGVSVFDPHYDIEKLVELRMTEDALKERD